MRTEAEEEARLNRLHTHSDNNKILAILWSNYQGHHKILSTKASEVEVIEGEVMPNLIEVEVDPIMINTLKDLKEYHISAFLL